MTGCNGLEKLFGSKDGKPIDGNCVVNFTDLNEYLNDNVEKDGKAKHAKGLILSVDPENYSSTYKVVDGHLLEEYKSFIIKVKATSSDKGQGCVVIWEIEYEKLHEGVAHPETFLALLIEITKYMGSHLAQPK